MSQRAGRQRGLSDPFYPKDVHEAFTSGRDVPAASPFPRIVGVDSGKRRLAVCILSGSDVDFQWYESQEDDPGAYLLDLKWWLQSVLMRSDDITAETVQVGPNPQSAIAQSMTIGVLLATVGGRLISPTTWKAVILGHGSADKSEIRNCGEYTSPQISAQIGQAARRVDRRQDLWDAYWIALYGHFARRQNMGLDAASGL